MKRSTWVYVVAAALVLVAGTVLVSAGEERIEVRVEKDSDSEVAVTVNDVTEVIHLDDLSEGESRTFDVGDHELVVKRVGDELTIITEGHAIANIGDHGMSKDIMVWVGDEGENLEIHKEKVIVIKADGDADALHNEFTYHIKGDGEFLDGECDIDIEEILATHGGEGHAAIFIDAEGGEHHPTIIKRHMGDNMVKYRCADTGSILMVKKDDAIEDVYICPATGCVMEKLEEPQLKMITIKVEEEDED